MSSGLVSTLFGTADGFASPQALGIDPDDSFVLVTDYGGNAIRRISLESWALTTVASSSHPYGVGVGGGAIFVVSVPLGEPFYANYLKTHQY